MISNYACRVLSMSKGYTDQERAAAAWRKQQKEQEIDERRVTVRPVSPTNIESKLGKGMKDHVYREKERNRNRSRSRSRSRLRRKDDDSKYGPAEQHSKTNNLDVDEFGREIRVGVKRKTTSSITSRSNRSRSRSSSRYRSFSNSKEKQDWEHDKYKEEVDEEFR